MNFIEFIAFGIMEQHDDTVFVAELGEREVERPEPLEALVVTNGVLITRKSIQALRGEENLLDSTHAAPRKTPPLVDEEVVHDTGQPGPGFIDGDEIIELFERLDQQILEQVFGFSRSKCGRTSFSKVCLLASERMNTRSLAT